MRVLAIDPGNIKSGYCLIEDYRPIEHGKVDNQTMLDMTCHTAEKFVDAVAIEKIASYGMAVGREVFDTCEWTGRFVQSVEDHAGCPWGYVFRRDEKMNLCGSVKANDSNIRRALIDRFAKHDLKNGKGTKDNPDWFYGFKADVWAAYAVGVTWLDTKGETHE